MQTDNSINPPALLYPPPFFCAYSPIRHPLTLKITASATPTCQKYSQQRKAQQLRYEFVEKERMPEESPSAETLNFKVSLLIRKKLIESIKSNTRNIGRFTSSD